MEDKTRNIIILVVVVGSLALIIGLVASSLKTLQSYEVGLQYDTINKKLNDDVRAEGLHAGPPGYEMIVFPSIYKSIEYDDLQCLNFDGVTITLDISYQFKANQPKMYDLVLQFRNFTTYEDVLNSAGKGAVQIVCSMFDTDDLQQNRSLFQDSLKEKLSQRCVAYDCEINDVQVNDIRRPTSYESAIRAKQAAVENVKVAEEQRPKSLTQAETQLREAEATSRITIERAESQARILQYQAETEARAVVDRYTKEAETYAQIASNLNLTTEGVISYLGIRTIERTPNPVYVGLKSPAKTSYAP